MVSDGELELNESGVEEDGDGDELVLAVDPVLELVEEVEVELEVDFEVVPPDVNLHSREKESASSVYQHFQRGEHLDVRT